MKTRAWVAVALVASLLASCGSEAEPAPAAAGTSVAEPDSNLAVSETTTTAAVGETTTTGTSSAQPNSNLTAGETTTTSSTTTTTVVSELTPTKPDALATMLVEGFRYHDAGEPYADKSGLVDVVAPTEGDAPWPTVVIFHGGPSYATKDWHHHDAQLIAERGSVVFLPNWGQKPNVAPEGVSTHDWWALDNQQVACAVVYAHAHAAEFGGDPDNITLYGYSAGATAALIAGLGGIDPMDTCAADGASVDVQAIVPVDADWVLGGHGDQQISADPEAFYARSPWRYLDGSQDVEIHVTVVEISEGPYVRSVEPDPATSWLSYRHYDIDLVADLDARGYLADGSFGVRESGEYAVEILNERGYDATLVVMTGASHDVWGDEGRAIVVDTVVDAANK